MDSSKYMSRNCNASTASRILQPQWACTNKLLPLFQGSREVWELFMGKDSVWTKPHQLLSDNWQQTGIRRLTGAKCREFLGAEGPVVTFCRVLTLRAICRSVLNEHGLEYEGQY